MNQFQCIQILLLEQILAKKNIIGTKIKITRTKSKRNYISETELKQNILYDANRRRFTFFLRTKMLFELFVKMSLEIVDGFISYHFNLITIH